jgi:hypothetical protein
MNPVTPNTASASTSTPAEAKHILLKDIGAKWGKFSEQELGALKNKDDLVTQLVAKYSIDNRRPREGPPDLIWMQQSTRPPTGGLGLSSAHSVKEQPAMDIIQPNIDGLVAGIKLRVA